MLEGNGLDAHLIKILISGSSGWERSGGVLAVAFVGEDFFYYYYFDGHLLLVSFFMDICLLWPVFFSSWMLCRKLCLPSFLHATVLYV